MELSEKKVRRWLERLKIFSSGTISLASLRKGQDLLGALLAKSMRQDVDVFDTTLKNCPAAWVKPHDRRKRGVLLYLHGGGYTCGDLTYAKGFGSVLAAECGIDVLCVAYRLAPESPYPAALDDAVDAYRTLLNKGYHAGQIGLCGESAGGGLCYTLCLRLRTLRLPLPACIVASSPWTDLTMSGASMTTNSERDPSLTRAPLEFYAKCYAQNPKEPCVSPLFGDLKGMPPSLLFAGSDEILLDDATRLHEKLLRCGCASELVVADQMWHAYLLYCIREREGDFETINTFLNRYLTRDRKLRWMRLDNAAKIFPAAKRRRWNNFFRLSAELQDNVDVPTLRSALDVTVRRFPSIAVRLCRGVFWYYLEELSAPPEIQSESAWPLAHAPFARVNACALRVIVYRKRVAVEFFHSLTDGNGGMVFMKSLLAEYVQQRYDVLVPNTCGILDRLEEPREEELEDCFFKNRGEVGMQRDGSKAFSYRYTPEKDDYRHLTTMMLDADAIHTRAKQYGVTVTVFLCSAMLMALQRIQNEQVPQKRRQKPIRVVLPVNLRTLFPSRTLRNFVHVVMPELQPQYGDYTFDEICRTVRCQLALWVTPNNVRAMITPNIQAESSMALRVMPLFTKNLVMKMIYDTVGERTSCINMSNLGVVELPEVMQPYVTRLDFIIGLQATKPNNVGVLTYNGVLYLNFIRNSVEPQIERTFFEVLRGLGVGAKIESNQRRF